MFLVNKQEYEGVGGKKRGRKEIVYVIYVGFQIFFVFMNLLVLKYFLWIIRIDYILRKENSVYNILKIFKGLVYQYN